MADNGGGAFTGTGAGTHTQNTNADTWWCYSSAITATGLCTDSYSFIGLPLKLAMVSNFTFHISFSQQWLWNSHKSYLFQHHLSLSSLFKLGFPCSAQTWLFSTVYCSAVPTCFDFSPLVSQHCVLFRCANLLHELGAPESAASSVSPGRRLDSQAAAAHSCGHRFTARVTPLLQHLLTPHQYSADALLSRRNQCTMHSSGPAQLWKTQILRKCICY